jgi:hypothetical protein
MKESGKIKHSDFKLHWFEGLKVQFLAWMFEYSILTDCFVT